MDQKTILIIVIALVFIFLLVMLMSAFMASKELPKDTEKRKKEEEEEKRRLDIKDVLDVVKNRDTSRNDLVKIILKVAKDCKFPEKQSSTLTKEAKTYLTFVLLLSSHKNADAKLIAFANEELKKANPKYSKEIDIYENEGIKERRNRM